MISRRAVSAAIAAILALTGVQVTSAPAKANTCNPVTGTCTESDGWCLGGELCLWRLENFTDENADYYNSDADFTNDNFWFKTNYDLWLAAETVNDRASSGYNLADDCQAVLWQDVNYGGSHMIFYPLTRHKNLTNEYFDNTASSLSWIC